MWNFPHCSFRITKELGQGNLGYFRVHTVLYCLPVPNLQLHSPMNIEMIQLPIINVCGSLVVDQFMKLMQMELSSCQHLKYIIQSCCIFRDRPLTVN